MAEAPPLVLIPGLLCDHRLWAAQSRDLAGRVSVHHADHTGHDSLEALARAILTAAPPRFALAGLSMGGYIAFEILRQEPGRVTRLALLNTSARPDSPERRRRREGHMALAARGRFRGISTALLPLLIPPGRLADEALTGTILAMAGEMGVAIFLRQSRAVMDRPDSRELLADIRCPVLVVGGSEDQMTPPALQEEIAAATPGAELLMLPGCGHLAALEAPSAVSAAMGRWLRWGR